MGKNVPALIVFPFIYRKTHETETYILIEAAHYNLTHETETYILIEAAHYNLLNQLGIVSIVLCGFYPSGEHEKKADQKILTIFLFMN